MVTITQRTKAYSYGGYTKYEFGILLKRVSSDELRIKCKSRKDCGWAAENVKTIFTGVNNENNTTN